MEMQVSDNKTELISKINKDKNSITKFWVKAELNYNLARYSIGITKLRHCNIMRKIMSEIVGIALDDYSSENKILSKEISETFGEFWDFFYWWGKDTGIDSELWKKMEDFYHTNH